MRVFVFSYNRGRYLRNCLASIARHMAGADVLVMDDDSDDPEVHNAVTEHQGLARLVSTRARAGDAYLGGLYGNMQHALELSRDQSVVLFLQDDMQIVRDLGPEDMAHWERYFSSHSNTFQLHACFVKRKQVKSGRRLVDIDRDVPVYWRTLESGRRSYFSAIGVFHVERMRALDWRFEPSEGENNRKVRESGLSMGMTPWPFMMWLPNAESAKFRRRGLLHRFAEWRAGVGFYPYRPLTGEKLEWLLQRPLEELPVAEELLEPQGLDPGREWLFADATKAVKPLHRHLKRRKKRRVREQQATRPDPGDG